VGALGLVNNLRTELLAELLLHIIIDSHHPVVEVALAEGGGARQYYMIHFVKIERTLLLLVQRTNKLDLVQRRKSDRVRRGMR